MADAKYAMAAGSGVVIDRDRVFFFGGAVGVNTVSQQQTLLRLNASADGEWEEFGSSTPPPARAYHAMASLLSSLSTQPQVCAWFGRSEC